MGIDDRYIGLTLAVASSLLIGTSFIITKKGLIDANDRHGNIWKSMFLKTLFVIQLVWNFMFTLGFAGDDHSYLKNPIWWLGMTTSRFIDYWLGDIKNNI